jgi:hypothetical protein
VFCFLNARRLRNIQECHANIEIDEQEFHPHPILVLKSLTHSSIIE